MKVDRERLLKSFISLVQISSESGEEKEIIEYLEKEVQKLGFSTAVDGTGNLVARNSITPKIALIAHVDTVKPGKNIQPIVTDEGIIRTDHSTILGADNKSGVATILEVLTTLYENDKKVPLEIIFTVSEEVGLLGSGSLDFQNIKSKIALNLDAKAGEIVVGEPANMKYDIEITGRAAHAGVHPERGISAIEVAADAISKLEWGRIDTESSANVGTISGGTARNTVAETATLLAEVRSRNTNSFEKYYKKLEEVFTDSAKKYNAKIKIDKRLSATVYNISSSDTLVCELGKIIQSNGLEPNIHPIYGNTDANVFNKNGIKTISTGSTGSDIHTTNETLKVFDLVIGTQIVSDFINNL